MNDFEIELKEYLLKNTRVKQAGFQNSSALFSSGMLDSFAMIDLVAFIEKSGDFSIKAKEVSLRNLDSIEKIINFYARKKTG